MKKETSNFVIMESEPAATKARVYCQEKHGFTSTIDFGSVEMESVRASTSMLCFCGPGVIQIYNSKGKLFHVP